MVKMPLRVKIHTKKNEHSTHIGLIPKPFVCQFYFISFISTYKIVFCWFRGCTSPPKLHKYGLTTGGQLKENYRKNLQDTDTEEPY